MSVAGVLAYGGAAAQPPPPQQVLGKAIILTANERLSLRLNSVLQAIAASVELHRPPLDREQLKALRAGGGGADLPADGGGQAVAGFDHARFGNRILVNTWAKTYGAYWQRGSHEEITGSVGRRGGIVGGVAMRPASSPRRVPATRLVSGNQNILVGLNPFTIPSPEVQSYAGIVGVGGTARLGFNWGLSARGQYYHSSDGTSAVAGYLRGAAVF